MLRDPVIRASSQMLNDCRGACGRNGPAPGDIVCRCPLDAAFFSRAANLSATELVGCFARHGPGSLACSLPMASFYDNLLMVKGIESAGGVAKWIDWFQSGIYVHFLKLWRALFHPDQILVVRSGPPPLSRARRGPQRRALS